MAEVDLSLEVKGFLRFLKYFRLATTDMETQYLEIPNARRALFMSDPEGFSKGCNVHVEAFLVDEKIGWDRDESEI
jgi:hypothetical protein